MKNQSLVPIRIFCVLISVYHVGEGVIGTLSSSLAAKVAKLVYGVTITAVTPQAEVFMRFIGAFAITFGIMMGFAAIDPKKNTAILNAGIVFFAIRLLDRLIFANVLQEAFAVTGARNVQSMIYICIMLIGLVVFKPKKDSL